MEHGGIPVARLMTAGALTVTPETVVKDAAGTMLEKGVGSLVVVNEHSQPVGMLTNTDLAEIVSNGEDATDATVAEYMTDRVVTVGAQNSIRDAAAKMIINGVHHLPVTDDEGGIVGMLSTIDLTAYFSYAEGSDTE